MCISYFVKLGVNAFPLAIVLCFIPLCTNLKSFAKTDEFERVCHNPCSAVELGSSIAYLLCVLCILLLISGIEPNPGPVSGDTASDSSVNSSFNDVLSHTVSFVHLNVQSILPKLDLLTAEYSCHDILSFTESWLNPQVSDDRIKIPGYKPPFRRDRMGRVGGGVVVYIRDNINCHVRPDLHVGNVECIWLELKFKTKMYLYGTFYVPPNSNMQIWDDLQQSIDLALSSNIDIIVTGDFNVNQLRGTGNDKISLLKAQFSLNQLVSDPTYITEHSQSLLDLILVNNPRNILLSEVGVPLLDQVRYHLPVIGVIDQPCKSQHSFKRKIYIYDRGDYNSYREQLSEVNWDLIFETNDVDTITRSVTEILIEKADNTIPNRIITVRKDSPPWLTTEIKRHLRKKNRQHKLAKRTQTTGDWAKFRLIRNNCNKLVLSAKHEYFVKLSNEITTESRGNKQYWKLINSLMNIDSPDARSIPPLQVNDDLICNDKEKAKIFNDFFCSQSDLDDSNVPVPDITQSQNEGLEHIVITENEVEDILKTLDISKASGPDSISPRLLKEAAHVLSYPLCRLFNLSLTTGIYPSDWKCANVSPVFKKDSRSNYRNYRPISLLSVIGKVMERCVYKHIYNFIVVNNIITPNQSGFTPGDSAINQLLYITNEFGRALDAGKEIRVIFCDISKAFDRVWHKGLLKKLEAIGIKGPLLIWVQNYLSDRKQRVVINNVSSEWSNIKAGVPQGSILGPLFFIIFINDIITDIQSQIKLFALVYI